MVDWISGSNHSYLKVGSERFWKTLFWPKCTSSNKKIQDLLYIYIYIYIYIWACLFCACDTILSQGGHRVKELVKVLAGAMVPFMVGHIAPHMTPHISPSIIKQSTADERALRARPFVVESVVERRLANPNSSITTLYAIKTPKFKRRRSTRTDWSTWSSKSS